MMLVLACALFHLGLACLGHLFPPDSSTPSEPLPESTRLGSHPGPLMLLLVFLGASSALLASLRVIPNGCLGT